MDDRILKHSFSPAFFMLKNLELNLTFHCVQEEKPLKDLVLIEKHFFRDEIISEFVFTFPVCIPGSTNTWQYVYDLPQLSAEKQKLMMDNPFETQSDSFFFADGKLIVHNKAAYEYV